MTTPKRYTELQWVNFTGPSPTTEACESHGARHNGAAQQGSQREAVQGAAEVVGGGIQAGQQIVAKWGPPQFSHL